MSWTKDEMAKYVATLLEKGSSVNLGIGLPSLVAENIDPSKEIMIHSENGVLGVSGRPSKKDVSPTLINAGKETISINQAASYFDSSLSFGMIRGGHIDYCILGAMEVDCERNLANWMIPGKKVTGMGGAMDLVNGAKNIIVMMNHFNKSGDPKLLKTTALPLTGKNVVDDVITDLGHFRPNGTSFEIIKLAPGVTEEDCKLPYSLSLF
ncbi:MAG: succinyl-CoA--3-ketoacid-CoA transferase [Halobacteriovoraceae bacterium]|nr:succinyl-CoA--3-ketoacid-CoA transferase [Halobacteriovoraceae bacterium]